MGRRMKILGIITIVALLLGGGVLLPVVAAPDATVSIDAPDEVDAGSDFTANVNISQVTDFDSCNYDVSFNASVLRLDDVTSGLIDSTAIPVDIYNEISTGTYRVVQNVSGLSGATGSGYLAVLHFHVIGSEGDSSPISLSNGVLSNILAEEIPANWFGDSVTVSDTTSPTIVSVSPAADKTDVAVTTTVTATFSEAMNAATITTSSFTLDGVSGSVSYDSVSYTATFTPSADLSYDTTYTATLSTVITDAAGNPLASAYSWSFTTTSAPPVTVSIDAPAEVDAGSDFTADVNISQVTDFDACQYDVTFDASVLRLDDVTSGLIGSIEIPVDIYNEISTGTYRVVQNVPGLSGATGSGYLAVLHFHVIGSEGDSSAISLSNGMLSNILAEEIEATWVGDSVLVGPAGDVSPPIVFSTSPVADATDVAVDTVVTATFNEAMDESTITTSSFTLDSVAGTVSYNSGTYTATFTPVVGLAYETTYTAALSTAITDAAGNPLAAEYSWSFTTASVPPGTVLVSIDAPDGPRAGDSFTANVDSSQVTDFDSCNYDVTFDASVLRLDDVTSGLIGSIEIPVDIYNEISTGTYRVVQNVSGLSGATGSGSLAVLHFQVVGSEGDISAIDLSNGTLSNIQAEEIPAVWVGDSVTIARRPSGGGGGGGGGGGAPGDTTPPAISDVSVADVTTTGADVGWNTDEESDSQVEYWASPGALTPLDTEMVLEHLVHLDELTPGSTYYFKVRSSDTAGNLAVSEEHTFTTLGKAAAFTGSKLSVSPSEVYIGETVTISVLITNSGDAAGSYTATLRIDGEVEATREIMLNAGASKEVTFTTAKDVAGTYSVEVDGLSGSFTVEEKPGPPAPPPETTPAKPGVNWPIIWGIMAGVLVVGVIIFWVAMKRRA
jgi:hypothetical protein